MGEDKSINNTNTTRFMAILTLESLDLSPSSTFYVLTFSIITYCFILVFQFMLLVTIVVKKELHKPMYILLFNLSLCDILGVTAFYPQLFNSIMSQSREISYPACVLQGFLIHYYGTGSLLFLTVMAYDRYIAICMPLRYHNLITIGTVMKFICIVWVTDLVIIGSSFLWTMTKEICRTNIVDTYCNNPSLMKLICEDTRAQNYYGLFTANLVQIPSILIVSLTYIKILKTCRSTKQTQSIRKAMQTCGTHLVVFLTFELCASLLFISHRLESIAPNLRRAFAISIVMFPPILNPLIYGLNTREIRQAIFKFFQKKISYI